MSKKKKSYIISLLFTGIIFVLGVIYIFIPSYYKKEVDTNNLFISITLIYSLLSLIKHILRISKDDHVNVHISIASSTSALLNIFLSENISSDLTLVLSLLYFVLAITLFKLYSIHNFKKKREGFYYMEIIYTFIILIIGLIICFNIYVDLSAKIIMLGFFFIILSVIDSIFLSLKFMLKSARFLNFYK